MDNKETKRKIKKVIDKPALSFEKGVKKGWKSVKKFGKNLDEKVMEKIKKEEKK